MPFDTDKIYIEIKTLEQKLLMMCPNCEKFGATVCPTVFCKGDKGCIHTEDYIQYKRQQADLYRLIRSLKEDAYHRAV